MEEQVFDAAAFCRFDLGEGEIRSAEDGALLMMPPEVAAGIAASPAVAEAARRWGQLHGRGLRSALEIRGGEAGMELLSQHLCGTVAVMGLGRISLEVHGNALVIRVPRTAAVGLSQGLTSMFSGFVAGYLEGLSDHAFEVASLGQDGEHLLLLAGNKRATSVAARLSSEGRSAMDIVRQTSSWSIA